MIEINDLVYLLVDDYEESHGLFRDKQGIVQDVLIEKDRAVVDFGHIITELPLVHIKISSQNKRTNEFAKEAQLEEVEEFNKATKWNPEEANISPTGSLRYNSNKLPLHLVPTSAIRAIATVLQYGTKKYPERNWEKGSNWSVPRASGLRHDLAHWDGEDLDPESGLPHVYHKLMNAAMEVEYYEKYKELDDRPNKINNGDN